MAGLFGGGGGGSTGAQSFGGLPRTNPTFRATGSGGGINVRTGLCPPGTHQVASGRVGGGVSCVADTPSGGGGGGRNTGAYPTGGGSGPIRPNPVPINPQAEKDPSLEAYRQQYMKHVGDLESGAGHSMDVLVGSQKDNMDAQIEQMRQQAAAQGIPFDETAARSELNRGVNSAMAQEKLGREGMITQAYQGGLGIVSTPATERNQRLGIDLSRDIAENDVLAKLYGLDISKYSTDVGAATAANQQLLDFYARLMSGLGSISMVNQSYIG